MSRWTKFLVDVWSGCEELENGVCRGKQNKRKTKGERTVFITDEKV